MGDRSGILQRIARAVSGALAARRGSPASRRAAVDAVQAALDARLRPLGFERRGRTFNRAGADGLTHVIALQIGQRSLAGKFTVNLGVYVPEVAWLHGGAGDKGFVREYECTIRERLGNAGPEARDLWWRASEADRVAPELLERVDRDALPFLERLGTRDAILRAWGEASRDQGLGGLPPRIVTAIILATRGDLAAARERLAAHARERPAAADHVREIAGRLGIAVDGA